eukprot:TRINITY_DN4545_c0_g1_i2.p1 TRINITY_DN4545_c0_g1~~TRINITY_DN4545_c0_g1_i2.p1  ORF type:complete len:203 (-),score=-6.26 TRINITY_DN4545_c0_g1_i2:472-1080(-)
MHQFNNLFIKIFSQKLTIERILLEWYFLIHPKEDFNEGLCNVRYVIQGISYFSYIPKTNMISLRDVIPNVSPSSRNIFLSQNCTLFQRSLMDTVIIRAPQISFQPYSTVYIIIIAANARKNYFFCQMPTFWVVSSLFFSMYAIAQRQESDGCSQIGKLIFSKVVVYHFIYVLSGLFDKKQITIFLIQFVGFSIFLLVNKQKA